ncbi:MAG: SapC family protein [Amphiplicatus sp.]
MTRTALLNNIDHAKLRVITRYAAEFGDNVNQTLVFPTEFEEVQREYPIFFRKDESGTFQSVALLGFEKGENLFLDENGWNARYVPAAQARGPFSIALRRSDEAGAPPEPMIHVDLDHPRISETEGEPVFLPHGGNSPYLERVAQALRVIHRGVETSKSMFAAFEACGLIEPVTVEVRLSDTEKVTIPNRFTISRERLQRLSGEKLETLHKSGFFYAAFMALASLGNVSRLIELKNRKRAAEGAISAC